MVMISSCTSPNSDSEEDVEQDENIIANNDEADNEDTDNEDANNDDVFEQIGGFEVEKNKSSTSEIISSIRMDRKNGVRYVKVEVNGIPFEFIFDTGASNMCISIAEALILLKQGTITEEDIKGKINMSVADGSVSEGTVINLRSVKIGGKELSNVEAIVTNNPNAPLLLGQSVLEQFGNIEIDNLRDMIILKN